MSAKAKALKNLYKRGKIALAGVRQALEDGIITQEEFDWIVEAQDD